MQEREREKFCECIFFLEKSLVMFGIENILVGCQLEEGKLSDRSDVFFVCCLWKYLLNGRLPKNHHFFQHVLRDDFWHKNKSYPQRLNCKCFSRFTLIYYRIYLMMLMDAWFKCAINNLPLYISAKQQ